MEGTWKALQHKQGRKKLESKKIQQEPKTQ